jgi:Rrf2 family protein
MKLSARTEYACIAVLDLAASYEAAEPVRLRKIAGHHQIPHRFLVQILLQLKGAGLVHSTRGAAGGYQLARPPDEITLREVIEVIDGPLDPETSSVADRSPAVRVLRRTWSELSARQRAMLDAVTFADLVEQARGAAPAMYYI